MRVIWYILAPPSVSIALATTLVVEVIGSQVGLGGAQMELKGPWMGLKGPQSVRWISLHDEPMLGHT